MKFILQIRILQLVFLILASIGFACKSDVSVFVKNPRYAKSLEPMVTAKINSEGFLALEWSAASSKEGETFDIYLIEQNPEKPLHQLTSAAKVDAPLTTEVFSMEQSELKKVKISAITTLKEKEYVHTAPLDVGTEYVVIISNNLQGRTKDKENVLMLKPGFPMLLGASAVKETDALINLQWNSVAGATSYDIFANELLTELLGTSSSTTFTYKPSGKQAPASYWIKARRGILVSKDVYRVDLTASGIKISKVIVTSPNGVYKPGDMLTFEVHFSDKVNVLGDAMLPLTLDSGLVNAAYTSGSGTKVLQYSYKIQDGDDIAHLGTASALIGEYADTSGIAIATALPLPGSGQSIQDLSQVAIDSIAPSLPSSIGFSTLTSSDGTARMEWVRGADANFSLNRIKLCSNADCVQGCSSTEVTNSDFSPLSGLDAGLYYACVQTEDLVGHVSAWSVSLNALRVDKTIPTILSISSPTPNGSFSVGQTIEVRVHFSEPVFVTAPHLISLPLETGTTDHAAAYASGNSSDTLSFIYTVQAGDTSADLNYKASVLLGTGAAIQDVAGNNSLLAMPDINGAGSLSALKNFDIDGVSPTAPSGVTLPASPSYSANLSLSWTASTDVHFLHHNAKLCTSNDCSIGCTSPQTSLTSPLVLPSPNGFAYYGCVQGEDTFGNKSAWVPSSAATTVDTSSPAITNVSATQADAYFSTTDVITINVQFSKVVNVTGGSDIELLLETGATDRALTYSGGTGTNTLSFSYTVQNGDVSADLNYASTSALSLGATGAIADAGGNAATLTLPALNGANSLAGQKSLIIDTSAPSLASGVGFAAATSASTSFSMAWTNSTDANFQYHNIKICTASDCSTGCTSATTAVSSPAAMTGINGATYYGCVQGEDLLGLSSAFAASVGTITVDTASPTVSNVSSGTADGYYKAADTLAITLQFSDVVFVTGDADLGLILETGTTDRTATYTSGSGTNTLTFTYTVVSGDTSADLNYLSTGALALGASGTIKDTAGNNAALTLPALASGSSIAGQKAIVIDTTAPVAPSSVGFASPTSASLTFSMSWTNSTDTNFRYHNTKICTASDCSTGCTTAATSAVSPMTMTGVNGTTYYGCVQGEDFAGLTSSYVPSAGTLTVDTTAPSLSNVSSSTADGHYKADDTLAITLLFSEVVYVTNGSDLGLVLETGTTDRTAVYTSGSGTNTLTFTYTVVSGDVTADLNYGSISALSLGATGTIKDTTGNNAALTLPSIAGASAIAAQKAIVIDTIAPVAPSTVAFSGTRTSSTSFTMTWTDSTDTNLRYHNTKICTSNDCATGCTSVSTATSASKSMTGVDGATYYGCVQGQDWAGSTSSFIASAATMTVDTAAPTVSNVSSSTADGYYKTANAVVITVQFSEIVTVTNSTDLVLTLETGVTDRTAFYTSGTGTDTLNFTYTVAGGDTSSDLNYSVTNALSVGATGTIKDAAGNNAVLTLPTVAGTNAIAAQKDIVIDTTSPAAPSGVAFASSTSSSTSFSMSWTNSTDTNFRYHNTKICTANDCTTGCTSASNSVGSPNTMTGVNGTTYYGCVRGEDLVGLTSSFVASAGTLRVDTTPSTVTNVSSTTTNSSYKAGDVISISMTFSELVNLTNTSNITLLLETGATDGAATYSSGSGSTTLTFSYTVVSGDTSSDLDYASTSALSLGASGTIADAAGNNATLTLPAVAGGSSIAGQKAIAIDTTAPTVTITSLSTQDSTPPLAGTINDTSATISVLVNGSSYSATNNADGTWSLADGTITPLTAGTYNVAVSANDSAGNIGTDATTGELTINVTAFVSTWDTAYTFDSVTTDKSIKLPLVSNGTYNFSVNWGDGNTETITAWNAAAVTHTYTNSGVYTVTITGTITGWAFSDGGDKTKLSNISSWGPLKLGNNTGYFHGATNLTITATDILDTSGTTDFFYAFANCNSITTIPNIQHWDMSAVTSISAMFQHAHSFNNDLNNWNVANVVYMGYLFSEAYLFNGNVSSWNTGSVEDMQFMFHNASIFNQNIGAWDVSAVTNMGFMFYGANVFNQNIGAWNVSAVTSMSGMFYSAQAFNQNIGAWNVSGVTTMDYMFRAAFAFNQNIGAWNVSAVTNMSDMFSLTTVFNQSLNSWNVSNVIYFSDMFEDAAVFNGNISNWNTQSAVYMDSMFEEAAFFNQNIGAWNVSAVTNFSGMFEEASNFNQNIGAWNVSSGTNMREMFYRASAFNQNLSSWNPRYVSDFAFFLDYTPFSMANYDALLIGWSARTLVSGQLFVVGAQYSSGAAATARSNIMSNSGWTFIDGGLAP